MEFSAIKSVYSVFFWKGASCKFGRKKSWVAAGPVITSNHQSPTINKEVSTLQNTNQHKAQQTSASGLEIWTGDWKANVDIWVFTQMNVNFISR